MSGVGRWVALSGLVLAACRCGEDVRPTGDGGATADAVAEGDTERPVDGEAPRDTDGSVDDVVVYPAACRMPADPEAAAAIRIVDAFPALPDLAAPIDLVPAPDGRGRLLVAERAGRVRILSEDPAAADAGVYLDLRAKVYTGVECGLLGIAAHPRYADNGWLFTSYCTKIAGQTWSIVSRWSRAADDPDRADPVSEVEILRLRQPWDNHNGGDLAFGPDGRLYIGFGDGGSANDPLGSGQDVTTWLGAMLRVDVDAPSEGRAYGIPADNPFAAGGGAPEIYAWGLRNPWRFSFDRETGELWVGDVGQNALEEIDRVERGKNYGWKTMEGSRCRPGGPATCDTAGLTLPVAEYGHDVGNSVTGGVVYRGGGVPALYGTYLYADFGANVLFGFQPGAEAPTATPMLETPTAIAAFGEGHAGEVYLLGLMTGRIYRLAPASLGGGRGTPLPATLSATGCFSQLAPLEAAPGVLPYEVNAPFWTDGAHKGRWLSLPPEGKLRYAPQGRWGLPVGAVLVKHFAVETRPGDPLSAIPVETRLLVQDAGGVRGYSYRWDEAGQDAALLEGAASRELEVGGEALTWRFPSREQCRRCHTQAAGGPLSLETAQLDRLVAGAARPGAGPVSQVGTWRSWGLFAEAPQGSFDGALGLAAPGDEGAPLEARARAWLHANCAGCHLPGGPSGTAMDLSWWTPLERMGVCGVAPVRGDLDLGADARIVAPGQPDASVLWRRLSAGAAHRMPPLGGERPDPVGVDVVRRWIASLGGCP